MLGHRNTPAGDVDPDKRISLSPFHGAGLRPVIMRHEPGLAASPRDGIEFEVERSERRRFPAVRVGSAWRASSVSTRLPSASPTAPYSRLVVAAAEAEVLDGQNGAADTRAAQVGDHLAANAWA
jgi:hypothetical protein